MPDILGGASEFHVLLAAQPRLTALVLSPDGNRLVVSVQTLNGERNGYVSGLWEVDPTGHRESRRLTRSAQGAFSPAFAADGRLLFLSARENTDPSATNGEAGDVALWALPEYGEAERIARHPDGVSAFTVAMNVETISYTAALLPGAADADAHARLHRDRQGAKVTAILYEGGPTRSGGTDLGPEEPHTFVRWPDGALVKRW